MFVHRNVKIKIITIEIEGEVRNMLSVRRFELFLTAAWYIRHC